jgi:hypothetical protein
MKEFTVIVRVRTQDNDSERGIKKDMLRLLSELQLAVLECEVAACSSVPPTRTILVRLDSTRHRG